MNAFELALLILAVVALLLIANDLSSLVCSRCARRWAVFSDLRCWHCMRADRKRGAR